MGLDSKKIGQRIRYFRLEKKMTQEDLGKSVFVSGKHINYIENGKKVPSLELLVLTANILGVSANELLADSLNCLVANADQEILNFFHDCNRDERAIIMKVALTLKNILQEHKI